MIDEFELNNKGKELPAGYFQGEAFAFSTLPEVVRTVIAKEEGAEL